jgi:hypothetical protein
VAGGVEGDQLPVDQRLLAADGVGEAGQPGNQGAMSVPRRLRMRASPWPMAPMPTGNEHVFGPCGIPR